MKAMINNQLLTVEIKDNNYNDHAVEVEILEGTFKGKYTVIENEVCGIHKTIKQIKDEVIKNIIAKR